jgi:hypothetical protein
MIPFAAGEDPQSPEDPPAPALKSDEDRMVEYCGRIPLLLGTLQGKRTRKDALCSLNAVAEKIYYLSRLIVDREFPPG